MPTRNVTRQTNTDKILECLGLTRQQLASMPAHDVFYPGKDTHNVFHQVRTCKPGDPWTKWGTAYLYVSWDEYTDITRLSIHNYPNGGFKNTGTIFNLETNFNPASMSFKAGNIQMELRTDSSDPDEELLDEKESKENREALESMVEKVLEKMQKQIEDGISSVGNVSYNRNNTGKEEITITLNDNSKELDVNDKFDEFDAFDKINFGD